uniref:Putative secreted protein n=1 Tax=Ixodes ricinus TaxID=34613 RepID=A0A6B0UJL3_IXORI
MSRRNIFFTWPLYVAFGHCHGYRLFVRVETSVQRVLKVTLPEVNAWFFGRATQLRKRHIFNAFLPLFAQAHKSGTVFRQMGTTVCIGNQQRCRLRGTRRRTASTVHYLIAT